MMKLISLVLSFTLIFSSVAPSYAQAVSSYRQQPHASAADNTRIFNPVADNPAIHDALKREIAKSVRPEFVANLAEYNTALEWMKRDYGYNWEHCLSVARKAVFNNQDRVCTGQDCVKVENFAHACLHRGLEDTYYQGKVIVGKKTTSAILSLVQDYGASAKDAKATRKYLLDVLHSPGICNVSFGTGMSHFFKGGSSSARADVRQDLERRHEDCKLASESMIGLAFLSVYSRDVLGVNFFSQDMKEIYDFMEKYYTKDFGAVVMSSGYVALASTGHPLAFDYLDKMLTDVSVKEGYHKTVSSFLRGWLDALNLPSSISKAGINITNLSRGGSGRYLNSVSEKYQYLDKEEAARQGHSFTEWKAETLQYPMGNVLEDIGAALAQDSNSYSQKLAHKIVTSAFKDGRSVHLPLLAGVLSASSKDFRQSQLGSGNVMDAFYKGDWWDINEGTQRRIHNKMAAVSGKLEKGLDKEKQQRSIYNERITDMAQVGDALLMVYMVTMLVASIPAMGKGVANLVKTLRVRGANLSKAMARPGVLKAKPSAPEITPAPSVRPAAVSENAVASVARGSKVTAAPKPAAPVAAKPSGNLPLKVLSRSVKADGTLEVTVQTPSYVLKSGVSAQKTTVLRMPNNSYSANAAIRAQHNAWMKQVADLQKLNAAYPSAQVTGGRVYEVPGNKPTVAFVPEGGKGSVASALLEQHPVYTGTGGEAVATRVTSAATQQAPYRYTGYHGPSRLTSSSAVAELSSAPKMTRSPFEMWWRKTAVNAAFVWENAVFGLRGAARNPLSSLGSGVLAMGGGTAAPVELAAQALKAPVAIEAAAPVLSSSAFGVADLGVTVNAASRTSSAVANLAVRSTSVPFASAPVSAFNFYPIVGVLNEFHGGPSAKPSNMGEFNRGGVYLAAINKASLASTVRTDFNATQEDVQVLQTVNRGESLGVAHQGKIIPLFANGILDKAAVAALIAAALQTGAGVLSVNGLGGLTDAVNNSQYGKQINKALNDAHEAAVKQYLSTYGFSAVRVEDFRFQTLFVKQVAKFINGLDIPKAVKANVLAGFTTLKPGLKSLSESLTEKWNLNATASASLDRALKRAFNRADAEYVTQLASPKHAGILPSARQNLYQNILASELVARVGNTRSITPEVKASLLQDIGASLDQNMDKVVLPSLERDNISVAVLPNTSLGARIAALPVINKLPANWLASLRGENRETVIRYVDKTFDNKTFSVAEGYNFISTKKQYPDKPEVAQEKSDFIASHILSLDFPTREQLVWIMASAAGENSKLAAYHRLVERGESAPSAKEVVDVHRGLRKNNTTEFRKLGSEEEITLTRATERAMLEEENRMFLLPSSAQLLSLGADEGSFGKIDKDLVARALYAEADVAPILSPIYKKTWFGNTHYENLLPVYLRDGNGHLSANPKLFLMLNGKGVTVPQGFSVALDEKGVFKFAPTSLRQINASRVPYNKFFFNNPFTSWAVPKFWKKSNSRYLFDAGPSARRLVFETPLKNAELNALNLQLLKDGSPRVAVLPLAERDQFDSMMSILALIAGADTGASLSSQMKGTFAGTPFADSKSVGLSGFGYFSPLIANAFKPLVSHFGPYPALRAGFLMMAAVSAIGIGSGMWGYYSIGSGLSAIPMFAFFVTAISVASLFSTLASPVLKSAYPDKIVFASKNMAFTTQKGLSRLFVTALPAVIMATMPGAVGDWFVQQGMVEPVLRNGIAQAPALNWSLVVPAVGLLSLWGYWALTHSRLHSEYVSKQKKQKEAAAADAANATEKVGLAGRIKQLANLYKDNTPEDAAVTKKFETEIAPALKGITSRLGKIYESYAPINSVLMGLTAGMLYEKSTALLITSIGLFISWAIRKMSDKLLKSKIITDDQLTGLSLPLMSIGLLGLLIAPQDPTMILIPWAFMYISTPTFGVSENTRMINFVANMYKQEREAIRNNDALSSEEKTTKLDILTHEESDMKLRVASLYNKNNAKGMFTIAGVIALLILFKDAPLLASLTDGWAQAAADWMQPFSSTQLDPEFLRASMEAKGVAVTPEVMDAKMAENILSLSIFRLATILPAAISLILLWQNKSMIKQAFTSLSNPRLTQEVIKEGDQEKILKQLQFNAQNIKTNAELITSETEEIYSKVKGYAGSLTSEKNLQSILNRLVWLNNRYKAFSESVPNGFESLSESLAAFRFAVNGFQDLVKHNDVSEVLIGETDLLVSSVQGLSFDKDDDWASFPTDVSMLLSSSKKVSPVAREILPKIAYSIEVGDGDRLEGYLKSLNTYLSKAGLVKENGKNKALLERGNAILKDLKTQNYAVLPGASLQYLPEGVTSGVDYDGYEDAKTISVELERIINDFNNKKFYDGMKKDFESYYKQAMKELGQYAKANRKHAAMDENGNLLPFNEKRVDELEKKLNELYQGFMGEAPAGSVKNK